MGLAQLGSAVCCPVCHGPLVEEGEGHRDSPLRCDGCDATYPVIRGVPVLLGPDSAFDRDAVSAGSDAYYPNQGRESSWLRNIRLGLPGLALDLQAEQVDSYVRELLASEPDAQVSGLVVGAGRRADEYVRRFPTVSWLVTDVEPAMGAHLVGDVLQLPIASESMDLVVIEHVLEHVVDPLRGAAEIERIMRPGAIVLAKVPFSHPWHGGYIDFFRFTPAGFLAAFAGCEPLHIGHGTGPGSALAYHSYQMWLSLFTTRRARQVAAGVGRFLFGWLREFDRVLLRRPSSLDATMTIVFVGRRTGRRRTARENVAAARELGSALGGGPASVPGRDEVER